MRISDVEREAARRVAIQQRIGQLADDWLYGTDPQPTADMQRLAELDAILTSLEGDVLSDADPSESLLALAAETQLWLEAREREAAR